jgi:hypothetical protein
LECGKTSPRAVHIGSQSSVSTTAINLLKLIYHDYKEQINFFNSYRTSITAIINILKTFKMTESTHISLHLYIKVSEENQKQIKIARIRTEEAIITGFFVIRSNRNIERVNVLNHVLAFGGGCSSRLNFKHH